MWEQLPCGMWEGQNLAPTGVPPLTRFEPNSEHRIGCRPVVAPGNEKAVKSVNQNHRLIVSSEWQCPRVPGSPADRASAYYTRQPPRRGPERLFALSRRSRRSATHDGEHAIHYVTEHRPARRAASLFGTSALPRVLIRFSRRQRLLRVDDGSAST